MGIIGWIVLGLLAGAIAKAIMPGDDPGGIFVTMLIGIAGASSVASSPAPSMSGIWTSSSTSGRG